MNLGMYSRTLVILAIALPVALMAASNDRNNRNDRSDRGSRRNSEREQKQAKAQRPQSQELSTFKIIQERNIFNPNRYARSGNNERRQDSRAVPTNVVTLTGVMEYDKGTFAFFDGSSSAYRKVVKTGEKFADFKVTEIRPESVRMLAGTNQFDLTVGTQMRKEEGTGWHVSGRVELPSGAPSAIASAPRPLLATNAAPPAPQFGPPPGFEMPMMPVGPGEPFMGGGPPPELLVQQQNGTAPTNGPAAAPSTGNASTDEILRRLAQRREQEMNQ